MSKFLWGNLYSKVEGMHLYSFEYFFLLRMKTGLELQGDELSEVDLDGLVCTIDAEGLAKLDNLLIENNVDRVEWNDRLVEALRKSFENEIDEMETYKEIHKDAKIDYKPPHESWDLMYNELIEDSRKVISGIVQNWDQKYWRTYARKSATKTMSTGCLLPTFMFIICLMLIPIIRL